MNQSHDDFLAPTPAAPADPAAEALAAEPKVRVTVAEWTQIAHDGKVYKGGKTFSAPESLAESWIAYGWATKAK
jgi:hypothetical protein